MSNEKTDSEIAKWNAGTVRDIRRVTRSAQTSLEVIQNVLRNAGRNLSADAVGEAERQIAVASRIVALGTFTLSGLPDDVHQRQRQLRAAFEGILHLNEDLQ